MAKPYKNKKGFLIIQLTHEEAMAIWAKLGGVGVCDLCNKVDTSGYFVACLNDYLCPRCFNDWIKRAINFPEDKYFEKMNYDYTVSLLKRKNLWEDK